MRLSTAKSAVVSILLVKVAVVFVGWKMIGSGPDAVSSGTQLITAVGVLTVTEVFAPLALIVALPPTTVPVP